MPAYPFKESEYFMLSIFSNFYSFMLVFFKLVFVSVIIFSLCLRFSPLPAFLLPCGPFHWRANFIVCYVSQEVRTISIDVNCADRKIFYKESWEQCLLIAVAFVFNFCFWSPILASILALNSSRILFLCRILDYLSTPNHHFYFSFILVPLYLCLLSFSSSSCISLCVEGEKENESWRV